MDVEELYKIDMNRKVILSMKLPALDDDKYIFKSYKVGETRLKGDVFLKAIRQNAL